MSQGSALDSENSLKLFELFTQLHYQGLTIVVVTHNKELIHYGNHQAVINDGKLTIQY